ncbi:signal peptidase I [Candidatus Roizmanbacteria bacterium]|nr:signal peptidase I [Candidatus Roizmanbacteria bacterium]
MRFLKIAIQTILFIFFIYATFILLTSRMPVFGIQSMVVLTGSMEPTVPTGSIVFVKNQDAYSKQDIITFKNASGNYVTHRIVEKVTENEKELFRTQGDANNTADTELVLPEDVVGKSIFFIPQIGKLSQFLKTPAGFFGFVVVPGIIFVGYELVTIKREIEKITERRVMERMKAQET